MQSNEDLTNVNENVQLTKSVKKKKIMKVEEVSGRSGISKMKNSISSDKQRSKTP